MDPPKSPSDPSFSLADLWPLAKAHNCFSVSRLHEATVRVAAAAAASGTPFRPAAVAEALGFGPVGAGQPPLGFAGEAAVDPKMKISTAAVDPKMKIPTAAVDTEVKIATADVDSKIEIATAVGAGFIPDTDLRPRICWDDGHRPRIWRDADLRPSYVKTGSAADPRSFTGCAADPRSKCHLFTRCATDLFSKSYDSTRCAAGLFHKSTTGRTRVPYVKRYMSASYSTAATDGSGNPAAGGRGCGCGCGCGGGCGPTDCGGIPPPPGARIPDGAGEMEVRLFKRIEDVRADALRDHAENKRENLRLATELKEAKACYTDAVSAAKTQVGVVGFRMFLGLGAFSFLSMCYYLKEFQKIGPQQPPQVNIAFPSPSLDSPTTAPSASPTSISASTTPPTSSASAASAPSASAASV